MTQSVVNPPGFWSRVADMPRWVLVVSVVGGGIAVYYLYKSVNTGSPQGQGWTEQATAALTAQGYSQAEINTAIDHYLHGGMTDRDRQIIGAAIASVGTPDMPADPSQQVQSPTTGITPTATANPDMVYWYVMSTGVGWTSSFNGIAQQFYGDASKGSYIQQFNSNVTSTAYGRIPPGVTVKVPRSINA